MNRKFNKKIAGSCVMLLLSTSMLGTSTYAWFTMSREVEVSNIQLTATTPEDVQISLGQLGMNAATADTTASLAAGTGFIVTDADGNAQAPGDVVQYWSNTVDISNYYQFGKLIPASSTQGDVIIYTADAEGIGRTLKADAVFQETTDTATSHTYVAAPNSSYLLEDGKWADGTDYTASIGYDDTNDDGYYIDIPVWLRTSSKRINLTVTGYITNGAGETIEDDALYKAARVAILKDDKSVNGGIVDLQDVSNFKDIDYNDTFPEQLNRTGNPATSFNSILDSFNYNNRANITEGIYALSDPTSWNNVLINYGQTPIVTLTGGDAGYGDAQLIYIRCWLEGEDGNCWNGTAAQDWSIALKFSKMIYTAQP